MLVQLKDKIVLITGASSGIGREIALEFARENATVVMASRNLEKLEKVKKHCEELSTNKAFIYSLDISNAEQIDSVIKKVYNEVGNIDILVNNSGFTYTKEFINLDSLTMKKMFEVNVLGLIYMTQLVAIEMTKQQSGHIFNMGSLAGKVATPKTAVYSATKGAVISFSNALRMELKPLNIQVTTVNPGPVDTPFFKEFDPDREYLQKMGFLVLRPEQIARKIVRNAGKNKREINLPLLLSGATRLYQLFPSIGDYILTHSFKK